MIKALLLALLLSWDAPMTNCDGSPLTDLDHYEVRVFRAVISGWAPCSTDDPSFCPLYERMFARMATGEPQLVLQDPGLGEVLGYPATAEAIEAIDRAGNSSASCGGGA